MMLPGLMVLLRASYLLGSLRGAMIRPTLLDHRLTLSWVPSGAMYTLLVSVDVGSGDDGVGTTMKV